VADVYVTLSREDRLQALRVAATASGRPAHLLEKDVWVVLALEALFNSPEGENLVFKGGTSLSKGYGIIERFSEDIDLTYDVRKMIPDLAQGDPPIPRSNAQAKKWADEIKVKLPLWVKEKALPILEAHFRKVGVEAKLVADGQKLFVHYDPLTESAAYNPPRVMLEFGARATGEPCEAVDVTCDAADHVDLTFPEATPRAMLPERTFWEKATAVHVYCKNLDDDDRLSRHWYDLVKLDDAGYADDALKDRKLGVEVADHKSRFFREKDAQGNPIDYHAAVKGAITLVPVGARRKALEADYNAMMEAGMLPDDAESFDTILERCADLARWANQAA
jgi:hypothetical protein